MNIEELLKDRFVKSIRKSYHPCPLIGDKWFRHFAGGKPANFQFLGCGKLSKAMGQNLKFIAQTVVKNLYIADLKASIEITADGVINVRIPQKAQAGKHEPASGD